MEKEVKNAEAATAGDITAATLRLLGREKAEKTSSLPPKSGETDSDAGRSPLIGRNLPRSGEVYPLFRFKHTEKPRWGSTPAEEDGVKAAEEVAPEEETPVVASAEEEVSEVPAEEVAPAEEEVPVEDAEEEVSEVPAEEVASAEEETSVEDTEEEVSEVPAEETPVPAEEEVPVESTEEEAPAEGLAQNE